MRDLNAKKSDLHIRTAYGPKRRVKLTCSTKGRTKQSFKDDADINVIMARYFKTGLLDYVKKTSPHYGDVTGYDFQSAQNVVARARSMFHGLPAQVRDHFENKPDKFFQFVNDPRNAEEAREMGLLPPLAHAEEEAATPPAPQGGASSTGAPKAPAAAPKGSRKAAEPPEPNSTT